MDINTASVEELAEVAGISEEQAREVVEYREENGEFVDWDEVREAPGMTDEMVERLQAAGVTVGSAAT